MNSPAQTSSVMASAICVVTSEVRNRVAAFAPGRWLGFNNTTTGHDLHHELGRDNYGFYFRWWDKLMGTEHPGYAAKFKAVVADKVAAEIQP